MLASRRNRVVEVYPCAGSCHLKWTGPAPAESWYVTPLLKRVAGARLGGFVGLVFLLVSVFCMREMYYSGFVVESVPSRALMTREITTLESSIKLLDLARLLKLLTSRKCGRCHEQRQTHEIQAMQHTRKTYSGDQGETEWCLQSRKRRAWKYPIRNRNKQPAE